MIVIEVAAILAIVPMHGPQRSADHRTIDDEECVREEEQDVNLVEARTRETLMAQMPIPSQFANLFYNLIVIDFCFQTWVQTWKHAQLCQS